MIIPTHSVRVDGFEIDQIDMSQIDSKAKEVMRGVLARRYSIHPRQVRFEPLKDTWRPLLEVIKEIALKNSHNKRRLNALYEAGIIDEHELKEALGEL